MARFVAWKLAEIRLWIGLLQTEYEYENDEENFKEDIDLSKNLELMEVGRKEKKLLNRAIWGEWSWSIILGWEAILPIAIGCFLKMRKSYKYYPAVVDKTWEKKDKKWFCLTKNPHSERENRKGFQEGDQVLVFLVRGEWLIAKKDL